MFERGRVNYVAPDDQTGYACAAEGYVKLLQQSGMVVNRILMEPGDTFGLWYTVDRGAQVDPSNTAINIMHTVPEYFPHLATWLRQCGARGPLVGMTVWETSRIPPHWVSMLNNLHAVIVPTGWNRCVFRQSGVIAPIYVLPHNSEFQGIPASKEETQRLLSRLPDIRGRYCFYSIGAWSHRKGNDLLIRAFRRAFGSMNNVALVLKTSPMSQDLPSGRWQRGLDRWIGTERLRRRAVGGGLNNVVVLTDTMQSWEMRALHTLGDCYVSCARGEGWGLGLYEACFYGKAALAPSRGGHRKYLPDTHPGLIECKATPVNAPGKNPSYRADQQWFEINVEDAVQKMKSFQREPIAAAIASKRALCSIRGEFGEESLIQQIRNIMALIVAKT